MNVIANESYKNSLAGDEATREALAATRHAPPEAG
jgi:hypothetical protein